MKRSRAARRAAAPAAADGGHVLDGEVVHTLDGTSSSASSAAAPAIGARRPATVGRRPTAWACLLLSLNVLCAPAAATRIIGSDGKEYAYHGLRHRESSSHPRHAQAVPKQHAERTLNHLRRGHVRVNGTVQEPPGHIPRSHLVTGGVSGKSAAQHSHARSDRMKMMRADWCAGLSPESADFAACRGFMGEVCGPHGSQKAQLLLRHLCDKFATGAGRAPVRFDLRRAAPAPAPVGAPSAAFGRVNGMDAKAPMPEQGFSGRLVRHRDAETHVSDWQTEYGPKAKRRMSYDDICAMYPKNQWCILTRSRPRSRRPPRGRSVPPPTPELPGSARRWHEAVRESVGDPAAEARDAVQDGLGVGGSAEDAAKGAEEDKEEKEEEGPERDGAEGPAPERAASEGAASQPRGRQRRGDGDDAGGSRPSAAAESTAQDGAEGQSDGSSSSSQSSEVPDARRMEDDREDPVDRRPAPEDREDPVDRRPAPEDREDQVDMRPAPEDGEVPMDRRAAPDDGEIPVDRMAAPDDGEVPVDRWNSPPPVGPSTSMIPVYGAPNDEENKGWWPFSLWR